MVGRKGLEPSHPKILVPKTNASTNSAIAPLKYEVSNINGKFFKQLLIADFLKSLIIKTSIDELWDTF
jgi:hypothetical protein